MPTDYDYASHTPEQLRERIAELEILLERGILKSARFRLEADETGQAIEIDHWAVRLMADSFAETLGDAPNFLTGFVRHKDVGDIEFTLRRANGKTPAQKIAELEEKIKQLESDITEIVNNAH